VLVSKRERVWCLTHHSFLSLGRLSTSGCSSLSTRTTITITALSYITSPCWLSPPPNNQQPTNPTTNSKPYSKPTPLQHYTKPNQALHTMGLRVVLDVVYNHTFASGPTAQFSVLDKIVPGYYHRWVAGGVGWGVGLKIGGVCCMGCGLSMAWGLFGVGWWAGFS